MRKQASFEKYDNNTAASLIEDGDYRDAIICLSSSIMQFSGFDEGCAESSCCCHDTAKSMSLDQCMRNQGSFKEDGKPYVYKSPIRIPNQLNVICCKKCHDRLLSTAMVFNLALCHHLQALSDPSDAAESDNHLQKAIILYEFAFDIQKREHFDSNYIFVLAVMNNLAMIHRIRDYEELANEGFERILSILMYLVDSGKNGQCGSLEGFHYNVSLSSCRKSRESVAGAA